VQGIRQASLPLEGIEGIYLRLAALGRPRAHRRQAIDDRLLGLSLVLQTLHGSDDQVLTLSLTVFAHGHEIRAKFWLYLNGSSNSKEG
jgi:hypothetical protein